VFQAHIRVGGLEHPVALKMHTNLTVADFGPFTERVRALAGIGPHPHVMRLIDSFVGTALIDEPDPSDDAFGIMYTVADWVPGMSLPAALEATSKASGMRWVAQVARAASYMHSFRSPDAPAGLVHRDIKPSNVRVTPDEQAVLIDFGIARPHQEGDHTLGAGTYLWRAPEVIGGPGEPGPASDAWGLGALAYWVLLAESPRLEGAAAARELLTPAAKSAGFADAKALSGRIAEMLETHPQRRPTDLSRWADDIEMSAAGRRPLGLRRLGIIAVAAIVLAGAGTFTALRLGAGPSLSPAQSRQLAAAADRDLPRDANLGSLLALASYTRAPTDQADTALVNGMEQPLEGEFHDGSKVTALAYDRNGGRLVSSDTSGHIVVWNTSKGVRTARFRMPGRISAVAVNPSGTLVVGGNAAGVVDVWAAKSGSARRATFATHDAITSLAFDPGGTRLAVGTADTNPDDQGHVILWNLSTGGRQLRLVPTGATASSLAFDPADPTLVVVGAGDGALDFWYTATTFDDQNLVNHFSTGFGIPVTSVAFNSSGTKVTSGDTHGHVQLWSAQGTIKVSVPHDSTPVRAVAFGSDGTTVSVADTRGAVNQYGVTTFTSVGSPLVDNNRTRAVAFSTDGRNLAGTDASGTIALWSTEPRALVLAPSDQGNVLDCVAYSQTGDLLATSSYAGGVDLWSGRSGREMGQLPGTRQIHSLALDHNGALLATGDDHGHVVVWNTLSKKVEWRATAGRYIRSLAFSPDGQWLAAGDSSSRTTLWRAASGKRLRSLPDPRLGSVQSVAFSPDSTMLATGDHGGDVTLWRPATGRRIGGPFSVATKNSDVQSLAFSPDAAALAVADADGSTTLLAVPSGTVIRRLSDPSEVLSVAYSPDGRALVTGDHDGIIDAWDPTTGAPLGLSRSVGGQVYSLAFSADGTTLASANNSKSATLVPSVIETQSPAALAETLCRRVRTNLTRAEWNRYVHPRTPYQKVCPAY
jgi:WD40 repeat protein